MPQDAGFEIFVRLSYRKAAMWFGTEFYLDQDFSRGNKQEMFLTNSHIWGKNFLFCNGLLSNDLILEGWGRLKS